jgi:hypothetical protein
MIIRRTGGTLSLDGTPTTFQHNSFTQPVNAPSYTQVSADVLRVIWGATKNHDITPTTADIVADGWTPVLNANTGQGSTTGGATIVTATYAQGGSASDAINPDAWGTANMSFWAGQFAVKET